MKIVITDHEFRAHFPSRIKFFYEALKASGHELYVIESCGISICYQFSNDQQTNKNWDVLFPNAKTGTEDYNELKSKLYRRLDEINPDVVMSAIATFPVGVLALRWAKKHNKGVVEFGDAKKYTYKRSWFVHMVKRMMFHNVDAFFCPSDRWDDSMFFWGFKKEQLFYGLDVANNHEWEGQVTNEHFKDLPKEYMLTCSRQVSMKNLPRLVRCYQQFCNEGGKLPLVMVGEGVKHDELVRLANGNPNIIFLPFQTHERMRELFVQAKCLMLPSFKEETWGITVNEAMASSRIAACSLEAGCTTTIIRDGENGFSYDPYDEEAIIRVMHRIESLSKDQLEKMQIEAKNTIKDWGTERFAEGGLAACQYAYNRKKPISNPFEWLVINLWKGRMNIKNE